MRSRRFTRARYEEAAHLQTIHRETKKLWPRRWILFGPRVVPVSLWVGSLSKHQKTMDTLVAQLRGRIATLEARLRRQKRIADRTQIFIEARRGRLDAAAQEGLSSAAFIERERAGASAHWKRPAHGPDGFVLPVGSEADFAGHAVLDDLRPEVRLSYEESRDFAKKVLGEDVSHTPEHPPS